MKQKLFDKILGKSDKMDTLEITQEDFQKAWLETAKQYEGISLKDQDILLKGMLEVARQNISGTSPDGFMEIDTMWSIFLQQLMQATIEKGSKGVSFS